MFMKGNIFDSECEALVNAVNCVGVMGGGLALEFRMRFPKMHLTYVKDCKDNKVKVGKMHHYIYKDWVYGERHNIIINFPTKDHYKNESQLLWIQAGLFDLAGICRNMPIDSIAIPALGCGLGGLDWSDVRPLLVHFEQFIRPTTSVEIYEPI